MASLQAPNGTSKAAKFQAANPLGPMADPFAGLVRSSGVYCRTEQANKLEDCLPD